MKRIALGVALFCGLAACAKPIQMLSLDDPRPRQLLDDWVERARERQGMRGLARLAVDQERGSIQLRAKQLVVLERPSSLRVEVLGLLNQSLAVVATDGAVFQVYRAEDQSYDAGEVDDQLLWNEAGIDLRPEEAVSVLLGVPISDPLPAPAHAVRDRDGQIRIDLADARDIVVERVTFDPAGRLHAFEVLDDSGAVRWAAQFGDYRDVGGSPFAHSIGLDVRSGMTRAEISFRNVELNPDLPRELFRLFAPREGDLPTVDAERR